jgi:hypothetical protein
LPFWVDSQFCPIEEFNQLIDGGLLISAVETDPDGVGTDPDGVGTDPEEVGTDPEGVEAEPDPVGLEPEDFEAEPDFFTLFTMYTVMPIIIIKINDPAIKTLFSIYYN